MFIQSQQNVPFRCEGKCNRFHEIRKQIIQDGEDRSRDENVNIAAFETSSLASRRKGNSVKLELIAKLKLNLKVKLKIKLMIKLPVYELPKINKKFDFMKETPEIACTFLQSLGDIVEGTQVVCRRAQLADWYVVLVR
ncbi:unnamed protein product, partial [Nesidiocoris tenuis]